MFRRWRIPFIAEPFYFAYLIIRYSIVAALTLVVLYLFILLVGVVAHACGF